MMMDLGYTTPPSISVSPSPAGVSDAMGQAALLQLKKVYSMQ